jgi:hypothetical protein
MPSAHNVDHQVVLAFDNMAAKAKDFRASDLPSKGESGFSEILTNDQMRIIQMGVRGNLQIEECWHALINTPSQIKTGSMAGAEKTAIPVFAHSASCASLQLWGQGTPHVGAHPDADKIFRPDRSCLPCGIVWLHRMHRLRILKIWCVFLQIRHHFGRAMNHPDRFALPFKHLCLPKWQFAQIVTERFSCRLGPRSVKQAGKQWGSPSPSGCKANHGSQQRSPLQIGLTPTAPDFHRVAFFDRQRANGFALLFFSGKQVLQQHG